MTPLDRLKALAERAERAEDFSPETFLRLDLERVLRRTSPEFLAVVEAAQQTCVLGDFALRKALEALDTALTRELPAADEREAALRALREGDEIAFAAHLFLGNVDPNETLWGEVTERVPGADAIEVYVRAGTSDFDSDFCSVPFAQIDAVRRYDDDGQLVEVWPPLTRRGGVDD